MIHQSNPRHIVHKRIHRVGIVLRRLISDKAIVKKPLHIFHIFLEAILIHDVSQSAFYIGPLAVDAECGQDSLHINRFKLIIVGCVGIRVDHKRIASRNLAVKILQHLPKIRQAHGIPVLLGRNGDLLIRIGSIVFIQPVQTIIEPHRSTLSGITVGNGIDLPVLSGGGAPADVGNHALEVFGSIDIFGERRQRAAGHQIVELGFGNKHTLHVFFQIEDIVYSGIRIRSR